MKKYNVKTLFVILIILCMFTSEILMYNFQYLKYTEEIVTVFFFFYIIYSICKKRILVSKELFKIILSLIAIFLIGLLGTLIYNIQKNKVAIILDMLSFFKIFICSIGISFFAKKVELGKVLSSLEKLSKTFLTIGFFCGIISLFVDIGMRGQQRFGIYGFNFVYKYAHIYSMMILLCSLIISYNQKNNKIFNKYIFFAIVQMILTTKGPSIIWGFSILIFNYYFLKHKKISVSMIIFLIIITMIFGQYQIETYLNQQNSPRYVFYKYGIITAKNYAPLGSGFASFGSDMAGKYYSSLYSEYGFNNRYGMTKEDGWFLNDNYWPMIIGQFGCIGLLLVIYIVFNFYKIIIKSNIEKENRGMIISVLFYTLLHSLGSSTFSTSACVLLFMIVTIIIESENKEKINESN